MLHVTQNKSLLTFHYITFIGHVQITGPDQNPKVASPVIFPQILACFSNLSFHVSRLASPALRFYKIPSPSLPPIRFESSIPSLLDPISFASLSVFFNSILSSFDSFSPPSIDPNIIPRRARIRF
ncbi:hypothetical protein SLA2020_106160 [Shorea laevis]